jgi:hypothetical protein
MFEPRDVEGRVCVAPGGVAEAAHVLLQGGGSFPAAFLAAQEKRQIIWFGTYYF